MNERAPGISIDPECDGRGQPIPEEAPGWTRPGSPHAIQRHLGRKLQGMYAQIPATPLPDRLTQLLARLDAGGTTD